MNYKQFKLIIAEIEKEKKEKLSEKGIDIDKINDAEGNNTIDISTGGNLIWRLASLEKEKQFFRELTESVVMVDNFFNQIQVQYIVEVKQLIEQVKEIDNVAVLVLLHS